MGTMKQDLEDILSISDEKIYAEYTREKPNEKFKIGDVVYWLACDRKNRNAANCGYYVGYGIVHDLYGFSTVHIKLLKPRERRVVNGILYPDFTPSNKWYRLPKHYNYDDIQGLVNKHYAIENAPLSEDEKGFFDKFNPEEVKKFYEKGYLVDADTIDDSVLTVEFGKGGLYRIKKYFSYCAETNPRNYSYKPCYVSIISSGLYKTGREVIKIIDGITKEIYRRNSLSEYDYAVECIEKTLDRFVMLTFGKKKNVNKEIVDIYKDFLLSQPNVEDIDIRIFNGDIQWKYEDKMKWHTIEITEFAIQQRLEELIEN